MINFITETKYAMCATQRCNQWFKHIEAKPSRISFMYSIVHKIYVISCYGLNCDSFHPQTHILKPLFSKWGFNPIGLWPCKRHLSYSLTPQPVWAHSNRQLLQARMRVVTRNWPCWHPNLALQPPELQENKFLGLSHPFYGILIWQPQLTNKYTSIVSVLFCYIVL